MTVRSTKRVQRARAAAMGGAAGDALGQPHEFPHETIYTEDTLDGVPPMWIRRTVLENHGPAEYMMPAGTVSDDTHLTAAVMRCRLGRGQWWEQFARRELPLWLTYARGGDDSSLRASYAWTAGCSEALRNSFYFRNAVDNGAAKRVLGHAIIAAEFCAHGDSHYAERLNEDVDADAIITHGSPRAIVGARVMAHALTLVLLNGSTASLHQLADADAPWDTGPSRRIEGQHAPGWSEALLEMRVLLRYALRSESGPDDAGIIGVGASGPTKHLGTATVAAAIHLAARFGRDVLRGVLTASSTADIDTGTVASLAGQLLSAGAPKNMPQQWVHLADGYALATLAELLATGCGTTSTNVEPITLQHLDRIVASLRKKGMFRDLDSTWPGLTPVRDTPEPHGPDRIRWAGLGWGPAVPVRVSWPNQRDWAEASES